MTGGERIEDPTFDFYVFTSIGETPTDAETQSGVYLRGLAEATYLNPFFALFFETTGIGITNTDHALICAARGLNELQAVIGKAIEEVRRRPEQWPVRIGFEHIPFAASPGPPIWWSASRQKLLAFLEPVWATVQGALERGTCVHIDGGR
jgi:hypothetical protein